MMEMRQETDYVMHHIQKITGFFCAMRQFAKHLEHKGFNVSYLKITDKQNRQSLSENLLMVIDKNKIEKFEYQQPDEYRLDAQLKNFCSSLKIPSEVYSTEHFFTDRNELKLFFEGKKQFLMESFYRYMRKKHDILMNESEPEGGKWNYDHENRKPVPKNEKIPDSLFFKHNVSEIVAEINKAGCKHFGHIEEENFLWPINRDESLLLIDYFCKNLLQNFGTYQDAMVSDNWYLFHSRISFAMNTKMISPKEVIERVLNEYRNNKNISISQTEGYIRQILGWREYMRGIYWAKMPEYATLNYFKHENKLPDWFWTGKTKMNCLSKTIGQSLTHAYAHHIQRLMITGNIALLLQANPSYVDEWYLGVYIDAIEWVEITNTRGMSQFADGGIVGTKPYISSSNYIHKMSNYCVGCYYQKEKKHGDKACPFNSLYWNFYEQHRSLLEKNPRIGMMYITLNKMDNEEKQKIINQAKLYIKNANDL